MHDRAHQLRGQVRRVGELPLGIVHGLLHQQIRLQQLALEDVVHVDELVVVRQFALEQVVHFGDDLGQQFLHLVLHLSSAGLG
ncbi:hypothetical protein D3C71_1879730 [compost metagenome]